MSWLYDELPAEWPSNKPANTSRNVSGFSTSQSGDSLDEAQTVAIQENAASENPQWKQAIHPPPKQESHRLTKMFVPPPDLVNNNPENTTTESADHQVEAPAAATAANNSSSMSSHNDDSDEDEEEDEEPKRPISRRLKVFGRADTYTNERLGNLLSSMGGNGNNHSTQSSKAFSTQESAIERSRGATQDNHQSVADESDMDLANNLQSEGRKVLQGLAPFRPNLSAVDESSLDALEQQLTNQGVDPRLATGLMPQKTPAPGFETTSSSIGDKHDSSSQTLESLPAGLSNWDTYGGGHEQYVRRQEDAVQQQQQQQHQQQQQQQQPSQVNAPRSQNSHPQLLRTHSSQTLVGSGRSARSALAKKQSQLQSQPQTYFTHNEMDPEEEISVLGIREPIRPANDSSDLHDENLPEPAHLSAENHIQHFSNEFSTSTEQHTTTSGDSAQHALREREQRELEQREYEHRQQQQQLQRERERQEQQKRIGRQHSGLDRYAQETPHSYRHNDVRGFSRGSTETPRVYSYASAGSRIDKAFDTTPETFARAHLRFKTPVRPRISSASGAAARASGAPTGPAATATEDTSESNILPEHSIAVKDLSFSAGIEGLAQLIRERAGHVPLTAMESLDSLDLSSSELESIVGLDKFVAGLTTLFLHDNKIRSLEGLPFNLVHLDMSSNLISNINTFPSCFVSTLILSNNQLESLQPLSNLRALSSLDVSNNKLRSLDGIENLTALRTLNLRNNELTSLNLSLGMLVELDAAHNNITGLKLNTPNLESLDLEGNNVVAISEPLPNLRELNLQYNGATVDFKGWQSLETLLFDGNVMTRNLEAVSGILVTFSWEQPRAESTRHGNGSNHGKDRAAVEWKSRNIAAQLTSVRDLKLSGRPVGWPFPLEGYVFSAQHLDVSLCDIRELPRDLPRTFPFLRSLNLAFNKLDDQCISVLSQCRRLERLSLFGNRLKTVGSKLAQQLPHLRVIDSRSQNCARCPVRPGNYSTNTYMAIADPSSSSGSGNASGNASTVATNVHTSLPELQWIDGKWTNNASKTKHTTRPGFPSPLYPAIWNPVSADYTITGYEDEATMIGNLSAWDMVEAMYVHHYLEAARATSV